jgi:NAD(P)-dependent dehydrogenase (short-subunit alcohol dehydrogenase family)
VVLPEPGSRGERLLLDQLGAELRSAPVNPLVAYRGVHRWVRTYEPVCVPALEGRPSRLRDNGVYLITGGLGGIGLAIAEYLAKSISARLVLVSRTRLPEANDWDLWLGTHAAGDKTSKKIRRILALEESGAQVMVASADVANRDQMEKVLRMARERFGEIHGVVHSAGVPAGGIIELKTLEATSTILAPKVQGTMVLDDLFADAELDFVVLCSSLSAVLGGAGQVDYTTANAFLDAFAQARARNERRFSVSIAWDSWSETGMAVETAASSNLCELRRQDLEAGIRNTEGIEVFRRVLDCSIPHVLVSTRDLQGRIDQWSGREKLRARETHPAENTPTSPALPRPALSSQYAAPRSDAEQLLADIWGTMFGIDQVGIHDNFFELGGDSVLSIQITARANQAGLRFTPKQAFEHQTIAALAAIAGAKAAIVPDPGIVGRPKAEASDEASASLEGCGVSDSDLAEIARQLRAQAGETR